MGKSASKKVKMGKTTMKHKKMSGGLGNFSSPTTPTIDVSPFKKYTGNDDLAMVNALDSYKKTAAETLFGGRILPIITSKNIGNFSLAIVLMLSTLTGIGEYKLVEPALTAKLETELFTTFKSGDLNTASALLQAILKSGRFDLLNSQDGDGNTPLMCLALNSNIDSIGQNNSFYELKQKESQLGNVDFSLQNKEGNTLLHIMATRGDVETLKTIKGLLSSDIFILLLKKKNNNKKDVLETAILGENVSSDFVLEVLSNLDVTDEEKFSGLTEQLNSKIAETNSKLTTASVPAIRTQLNKQLYNLNTSLTMISNNQKKIVAKRTAVESKSRENDALIKALQEDYDALVLRGLYLKITGKTIEEEDWFDAAKRLKMYSSIVDAVNTLRTNGFTEEIITLKQIKKNLEQLKTSNAEDFNDVASDIDKHEVDIKKSNWDKLKTDVLFLSNIGLPKEDDRLKQDYLEDNADISELLEKYMLWKAALVLKLKLILLMNTTANMQKFMENFKTKLNKGGGVDGGWMDYLNTAASSVAATAATAAAAAKSQYGDFATTRFNAINATSVLNEMLSDQGISIENYFKQLLKNNRPVKKLISKLEEMLDEQVVIFNDILEEFVSAFNSMKKEDQAGWVEKLTTGITNNARAGDIDGMVETYAKSLIEKINQLIAGSVDEGSAFTDVEEAPPPGSFLRDVKGLSGFEYMSQQALAKGAQLGNTAYQGAKTLGQKLGTGATNMGVGAANVVTNIGTGAVSAAGKAATGYYQWRDDVNEKKDQARIKKEKEQAALTSSSWPVASTPSPAMKPPTPAPSSSSWALIPSLGSEPVPTDKKNIALPSYFDSGYGEDVGDSPENCKIWQDYPTFKNCDDVNKNSKKMLLKYYPDKNLECKDSATDKSSYINAQRETCSSSGGGKKKNRNSKKMKKQKKNRSNKHK